jgi:hypothetical protein
MGKYRITYTGRASSSDSEKEKEVDKQDLLRDIKIHQKDVFGLFHYFMKKDVFPDVASHDYTKVEHIDEFLDNINSKVRGTLKSFYAHKWWKLHVGTERHHALDYNGQEPINLGHIIHMCVDWVAAGTARSDDGKFHTYYPKDFDEKIGPLLRVAFDNTLKWLTDNSVVRGFKSKKEISLPDADGEVEDIGNSETSSDEDQAERNPKIADNDAPPDDGDVESIKMEDDDESPT